MFPLDYFVMVLCLLGMVAVGVIFGFLNLTSPVLWLLPPLGAAQRPAGAGGFPHGGR